MHWSRPQAAHPRPDCRHGIVHCQITRPGQLDRIAQLGLHVYAQSIFLDYDIQIVEARVGPELAASSYSWKTLLDRGVTVSNSSDCLGGDPQCPVRHPVRRHPPHPRRPRPPTCPARRSRCGRPWTATPSPGPAPALRNTARAASPPGYLADFVVLGQDPFAVPPEALHSIPVQAAYIGGRPVFQAGEAQP